MESRSEPGPGRAWRCPGNKQILLAVADVLVFDQPVRFSIGLRHDVWSPLVGITAV